MEPIDLNTHPLTAFFRAVAIEHERAVNKYGSWKDKKHKWQRDAIKSEYLEWKAANLKTIGGKERESQELSHLANVSGRRWSLLNSDKDARD
jgi:hypothetical protein